MGNLVRQLLTIAIILGCLFPAYATATPSKPWFVSVYGGQLVDQDLVSIPFSRPDFLNSYMKSLAFGREIGWYKGTLSFEWEGQIVDHTGLQDHMEYNGLLTGRWHPFPWDNVLDTNLGTGLGLSYASEEPAFELIEQKGETSKLLLYLMVELEAAVPDHQAWSVFTRIHHRSGIFGLINDVSGGSNFLGGGVRYRF